MGDNLFTSCDKLIGHLSNKEKQSLIDNFQAKAPVLGIDPLDLVLEDNLIVLRNITHKFEQVKVPYFVEQIRRISIHARDRNFTMDSEINLPNIKGDITTELFNGAKDIKHIKIPNATSIGGFTFMGTLAKTLDISSMQRIHQSGANYSSFWHNKIKRLYAPKLTRLFGSVGLEDSSYLEELEMPLLEVIEKYDASSRPLITNCSSLKFVKMDSLRVINNLEFSSCANLEEVVLPNVEMVMADAFYNCPKLKRVYLPKATVIAGIPRVKYEVPNIKYINL